MNYVIKRIPDGAYVSKPGSAHSYTRSLRNARTWTDREIAEGERCVENEVVTTVESEMRRSSSLTMRSRAAVTLGKRSGVTVI